MNYLKENSITNEEIKRFEHYLIFQEKSEATVRKYVLAIERLAGFLGSRDVTKELLIIYRKKLEESLKAQTINGVISAINSWLTFSGKEELKLKHLKVQRRIFLSEERELKPEEYRRLLRTARDTGKNQLYMIMLTLGGTGIRISELKFITLENVRVGRADIHMKGKCRTIILQKKLCRKLLKYAKAADIRTGILFRTRTGRALNRSNICRAMKSICPAAGVAPEKVFPHNFRHLFAREFYAVEKDLSHLADILGHSNIETTRIYVAVSTASQERMLEKMRMII